MARAETGFTDKDWRRLLREIGDGKILPVIGPELLILDLNGEQVSLTNHLARELVSRLEIDSANLPADFGLDEAVSQFLRQCLEERDKEPEDLYYEIREIMSNGAWLTPEPLKKLAAIRHFDLFMSTTFDGLLEQALNEVRYGGAQGTRSFASSKRSEAADLSGHGEGRRDATVFHVFGKLNPANDYAVTEEDMLEFSQRLLSRDRAPQNLFDVVRSKNLLLIGCNLPGWLARFIVRATKGDELYTHGVRGVIADRESQRDTRLAMFFERHRTSIYDQGNAVNFVEELHRRWMEEFGAAPETVPAEAPLEIGADTELAPFEQGSIFLSYASEDRSTATAIRERLEVRGLDVWFDQKALEAGDKYRKKIEQNIEKCAFFVPLISRHTSAPGRRFFRLEWKKAIDEARMREAEFPFIQPIVVDDTSPYDTGIPDEFKECHIVRYAGAEEVNKFVELTVRRIREQRRRSRPA